MSTEKLSPYGEHAASRQSVSLAYKILRMSPAVTGVSVFIPPTDEAIKGLTRALVYRRKEKKGQQCKVERTLCLQSHP